MTKVNRCYYEVLGIDQDSNDGVIKKAHRKMALKYHPDKNVGKEEEAANEFRLVQQAYECLSDPAERKWYDEHRDMILRGIKVGEGEGMGAEATYVFDVNSYHFVGCYDGYGDGEDGFFTVYRNVFQQVVEGELKGWISEGNIDETQMPNIHLQNVSFGKGSSDWSSEVSTFYSAWESFSTCLGFAWADKYDSREADSRWERRRMEEENKKARKIAKKKRNADVISLVHFVKKKDPRVETARKKAEQEKLERESNLKQQAVKKKQEKAAAKEAWLEKRQEQLRQLEMEDVNAGRVRLADLDDSDDDFYGGKRKKKGRKGKKKNKSRWDSDKEEDNATNDIPNDTIKQNETSNEENHHEQIVDHTNQEKLNNENITEIPIESSPNLEEEEFYSDEFSSEEEEPEIWRCECCRKEFKSEMQLKNHLKSKKHKETFKKWEKKQKKKAKEEQIMNELLDELDDLKT